MATKVYGSINPESDRISTRPIIGTTQAGVNDSVDTRAVQSPYQIPKIEAALEEENIGFWDRAHQAIGSVFYPQGSVDLSMENVSQNVGEVPAKVFSAIGKPIKILTTVLVLIALIVVVPRVLPVRS